MPPSSWWSCGLCSQSQEWCQSPTMLPQTPSLTGPFDSWGSWSLKRPPRRLLEWGFMLSPQPLPTCLLLSVTKPGDQGGHRGALPCASHTAHHHFAHCLFTVHMSPRWG